MLPRRRTRCLPLTPITTIISPQLGALLRVFVTRAGYRSHLVSREFDKDLDDLTTDTRLSTSCDLMRNIEETVQQKIARDSQASGLPGRGLRAGHESEGW